MQRMEWPPVVVQNLKRLGEADIRLADFFVHVKRLHQNTVEFYWLGMKRRRTFKSFPRKFLS